MTVCTSLLVCYRKLHSVYELKERPERRGLIQCFWYSRAPVFGFGGTSAAVFRAYLRRRHLLEFLVASRPRPLSHTAFSLTFRGDSYTGVVRLVQYSAVASSDERGETLLVEVLLGLDVGVERLAHDVVGHIEGSPAGGVEVHGLAGCLLGVLLGSGSGVVSIAGDAPAGVVVGVGAILGGVRDVLEACDGTGSRGCSDTAFSREEADKKRNSAERKARDARRAGRIPSESGPKRLRKSEIQRMLARSRATPRVHAPDEGVRRTRNEIRNIYVSIPTIRRIWRITHPSRRLSGLGLRNPC